MFRADEDAHVKFLRRMDEDLQAAKTLMTGPRLPKSEMQQNPRRPELDSCEADPQPSMPRPRGEDCDSAADEWVDVSLPASFDPELPHGNDASESQSVVVQTSHRVGQAQPFPWSQFAQDDREAHQQEECTHQAFVRSMDGEALSGSCVDSQSASSKDMDELLFEKPTAGTYLSWWVCCTSGNKTCYQESHKLANCQAPCCAVRTSFPFVERWARFGAQQFEILGSELFGSPSHI